MTMKEEFFEIINDQESSVKNVPVYLNEGEYDPDDIPENIDVQAVFPDGTPWAFCSNWAIDLQRRLGSERVALFGFWAGDNPLSEVSKIADGHDFAIVDARYIVDGWLVNVEQLHKTGVFDLEDDNDLGMIFKFYGNPLTWEGRNVDENSPAGVVPQKLFEKLEAAGLVDPFVPDACM